MVPCQHQANASAGGIAPRQRFFVSRFRDRGTSKHGSTLICYVLTLRLRPVLSEPSPNLKRSSAGVPTRLRKSRLRHTLAVCACRSVEVRALSRNVNKGVAACSVDTGGVLLGNCSRASRGRGGGGVESG